MNILTGYFLSNKKKYKRNLIKLRWKELQLLNRQKNLDFKFCFLDYCRSDNSTENVETKENLDFSIQYKIIVNMLESLFEENIFLN